MNEFKHEVELSEYYMGKVVANVGYRKFKTKEEAEQFVENFNKMNKVSYFTYCIRAREPRSVS